MFSVPMVMLTDELCFVRAETFFSVYGSSTVKSSTPLGSNISYYDVILLGVGILPFDLDWFIGSEIGVLNPYSSPFNLLSYSDFLSWPLRGPPELTGMLDLCPVTSLVFDADWE